MLPDAALYPAEEHPHRPFLAVAWTLFICLDDVVERRTPRQTHDRMRQPHHERPRLHQSPCRISRNSPRSTSAAAPGECYCGTDIPTSSRPSSTRRRATYRDTVTADSDAPCSAISCCQTRPAVCRCFLGTSRSSDNHRVNNRHVRVDRRTRLGGVANSNACRTVRRCTPCRPIN